MSERSYTISETRSQRSEKKAKLPRRSSNKIYRCPPTPPPEAIFEKERTFVLDCIASASISSDFSKSNPKLGPVIPPYNSQGDRHVRNYFTFTGVDRTLRRAQQNKGGTSIEGPVMDTFHAQGPGFRYLALRNAFGAGHSRENLDGHAQFMSDIRPITGYHGPFGFRRNTPWLRALPSPFGTASRSPTH